MLGKEKIKSIIPQREPFLMIDEIEEYIPGESAICYKDVKEEEWYFKGHFPGNPIMPGVLITESLAQAGAIAILSKEEIKKIIPQRDPFLMIDEVENFIPGESAIAYKNVNIEEWYFKGHFPGNPIMPGVLIAESLAQTGAVAILSVDENKGKNALFGGINKMKFKKQVVPGDRLKLEVKIIKQKSSIGIGEAIATVNGEIVAKGELTFAVV